MRITQNLREIKLNQVLDVSVDVHKEILNFFFNLEGKEYRDECPNPEFVNDFETPLVRI